MSPLALFSGLLNARSDYATTVAKAMVGKKAPAVAEAMVGETTDELESHAQLDHRI